MGNEPTVRIVNNALDEISFHKHNSYKTHCVECREELPAGRGIRIRMHRHQGSGYLCHACAGMKIITIAHYAIDKLNCYRLMRNNDSVALAPYDGTIACYPIPAAELAQAWHDHGCFGLRFAAENLYEQARTEFLTARNIPFTPKKFNIVTFAEALS